MCLIIAIVLGIFAFNAFGSGNFMAGMFGASASLLFFAFMIRNILLVKKERGKRK